MDVAWQSVAVARIRGQPSTSRWIDLGRSSFGETWRLESGGERYFVKAHPVSRRPMLEAEADGLRELSRVGAIRVPAPDPAVYFGDREADLAMTELFGGFGADFYAAYCGTWPVGAGYPIRRTLYNLYHILNHFNLFGGGYGGQAQMMISQLLAEVR